MYGFAAAFVSSGTGNVMPASLFIAALIGAGFTLVVSFLILVAIAFGALSTPNERGPRLLFVLGGFLGLGFLALAFVYGYEPLYAWMEKQPPIVHNAANP